MKNETVSEWKKLTLAALIAVGMISLLPGCADRQEDVYSRKQEEIANANVNADEDNHIVEEETRPQGRIPAETIIGREVCTYDPDDTIYYKTYYDDFAQGKIMNIDYTPRMEIRAELEDYFTDASDIWDLDNLTGMFYDDRTIETDEQELEQLFWEHGYLIDFCRADFENCHVRFVEITEKDGLSLYPIRILMQTWDDEYIYLQDITGPIPRKIREVMTVERNGVRQLVVHSTGLSREYVAEEELSFWERNGTGWILVPMELEIDISHAHNLDSLYPDLDRGTLYEACFYRDGIAYRPSLQSVNEWGDRAVFRLGIMEVVEKNKSFRLKAVTDVEGESTESLSGYIQFDIVEKPEDIIFEDFKEMDYALFLETGLGFGMGSDSYTYGLYGDLVGTAQEGEKLYFNLCSKVLPGECTEEWAEYSETYIQNLSPDLQWVVARRYLPWKILRKYRESHEGITEYKDLLLYEGEILTEKAVGSSEKELSFRFIKTGEGAYAPVGSELYEGKEQLAEEVWDTVYGWDMDTIVQIDENERALAVSQPDNRSIRIYNAEDLTLKRDILLEGVDPVYRLELSQFVGDGENGCLLFANGTATYRYEYPSGKLEKIGDFMFNASYSPDGRYLAYCTGNAELFRDMKQQAGQGDDVAAQLLEAWDEISPGWYVWELETGNVTYIPLDTGKLAGRYFAGGRCVWLEKDKLLQMLN